MAQDIVRDIFGVPWRVRERRPTEYGWDVCVGVPAEYKGPHGQSVVCTPDLAALLDRPSVDGWSDLRLPVSKHVLARLRRMVGVSLSAAREKWWADRIDDLSMLPIEDFAARHGCSVGAVSAARERLLSDARKRRVASYREKSDMTNADFVEILQGLYGARGWQTAFADASGHSVRAINRVAAGGRTLCGCVD